MVYASVLKLNALHCLNHCRSAPLLDLFPHSWPPDIEYLHQSGRSQSEIGLCSVQYNRMAGLDWTSDCQSWTGQAQSGLVNAGDIAGHCISHHHDHTVWQREAGGGSMEIQG